jgi:thiamine-monophosphate kinase
MKIKSEWDLIDKISSRIKLKGLTPPADAVVSIGDDCFAYKISGNRFGLISTDMSVEDVHFKTSWATPEQIGFKAMAGNISDISAMGGKPRFAFISIGIPDKLNQDYVLSIYNGMIEAANFSETVISGGDTVLSEKIIISILIYGEICNSPVKRSGAAAGEFIYVTGNIGASKAGLSILKSNNKELIQKYPYLIQRHLMPDIRSLITEQILYEFSPTAMIDISDSLLSDLRHICVSSGTGFDLNIDDLPISDDVKSYCLESDINLFNTALESGEEYELLFTSKTDIVSTELNKTPVTKIGKIINENFYAVKNGKRELIDIKGYDHFK